MDKENVEPQSKKRRLSLSLKKKEVASASQFADVTEETLDSLASYSMPKNSAVNCKWAMRNLTEWHRITIKDIQNRHVPRSSSLLLALRKS